MRIPLLGAALAMAVAAAAPASAQAPADTVEAIRARGHLLCGVSPGAPGFAVQDNRGAWRGFEVDYCRAVASVVLGDASKIRVVQAPAARRFEMLERGEVDLLTRNTSWTIERDVGSNVAFAGITYYDGQGFLVRSETGINRVQQMDGLKVCVEASTTSEQNLTDYARNMRIRLTIVPTQNAEAARAAFLGQHCDVLTSDTTLLAGFRQAQGSRANRYTLLTEVISKEPLGIVVRKSDPRFFDLVRWTHFALLTAEELNVGSDTVEELRSRTGSDLSGASAAMGRFFGRTGESGRLLRTDPDWAARMVRQVGNYREIWERNFGPLGLQRGLNLLWNQGGLHYAPPMR